MATVVDEKTMGTPIDMEKQLALTHETTGEVPEKILKHSHDADEAMKAFAGHEGEIIQMDDETNRRLLRKIDFNLMPVREAYFKPTSFGARLELTRLCLTAVMCHLRIELSRQ